MALVKNSVPPEDEIQRVKVKICGDEYVIKGQASAEYMAGLALKVDRKMREIMAGAHSQPRHRAAILAAIHLADEAERLRKENAELLALLEQTQ